MAAQYQCDKHVVKMTLESAQLLCSMYNDGEAPYRRTHYNHPCSVWARSSISNWSWLLAHGNALSAEYTYRYGKVHKCQAVFDWLTNNKPIMVDVGQTVFAQAMPDVYKNTDPVLAYRAYYLGDKSKIAQWNKARAKPEWYNVTY